MKKLTLAFILAAVTLGTSAQEETEWKELQLFNEVTFYDGYLFENNPDKDLQDGILRHSTSLYAVKMTEEQLASFGEKLNMNVFVKACCDNYDRIGNINLALVPKGAETYVADEVQRIEIGRFITPFMNKNKQPDTVPYSYQMDYLSLILRDATLREQYDLWLEFELFGVPYAANTQVAGCEGRSDVFQGTLVFETSEPALPTTDRNVLVPIVMKKNEAKGHNLNNYSEEGTDVIGQTVKTYTFNVPKDVTDSHLVIVTSNHGANTGGEEYNRRWHYIYVDDELMLSYKPGRESCEPFRQYNTQANGIYGTRKKTDAAWQSFSNWCPGDVIDNRIIILGAFPAGEHKVRIEVPEAKFAGQQGDIPVSMFFQGVTEGVVTGIDKLHKSFTPEVNVSVNGDVLRVTAPDEILNIDIYDLHGKRLIHKGRNEEIGLSGLTRGVYLINVELLKGVIETHKFKY